MVPIHPMHPQRFPTLRGEPVGARIPAGMRRVTWELATGHVAAPDQQVHTRMPPASTVPAAATRSAACRMTAKGPRLSAGHVANLGLD